MNTSTVVQFYSKYMAKYSGWQQRFSVCSDCGWAEPVCLPVDDEYDSALPNGYPAPDETEESMIAAGVQKPASEMKGN